MDSKKIVANIFERNNINWEIKSFNNYIDPKCKSPSSIYDKLFRLYSEVNGSCRFTILDSKIDDLLRMTVIVEYSDVIQVIQKLKNKFSDLSGYLQIEKAGYRGIHLNLKIDGIPCEIQLAPQIVVMCVDYLHTLYEKWRSFDYNYELNKLNERKCDVLNFEYEKNKKLLELKLEEEKRDFKLRNKVYGEVYEIAGFSFYRDVISEALDELNNSKKDSSSSLNSEKLKSLLNENLLIDGKLNKSKVEVVAKELSENMKAIQEKFVIMVKECLNLK